MSAFTPYSHYQQISALENDLWLANQRARDLGEAVRVALTVLEKAESSDDPKIRFAARLAANMARANIARDDNRRLSKSGTSTEGGAR